jgi:hypothetical protein
MINLMFDLLTRDGLYAILTLQTFHYEYNEAYLPIPSIITNATKTNLIKFFMGIQ